MILTSSVHPPTTGVEKDSFSSSIAVFPLVKKGPKTGMCVVETAVHSEIYKSEMEEVYAEREASDSSDTISNGSFDSDPAATCDDPPICDAGMDHIPACLELPSFTSSSEKTIMSRLQRFIRMCLSRGCSNITLFDLLRTDIIGSNVYFEGPFGKRLLTYADYFASGKPLFMIEEFISAEVLPFYGNTHSEQSVVAVATHSFRKNSRDFIKYHMAGRDLEKAKKLQVVFAGSGATAACNTLVHMFGLRSNNRVHWERIGTNPTRRKAAANAANRKSIWDVLVSKLRRSSLRPVVFVSLVEHNSNLLPWRVGTFADIVYIPFNPHTFQPDIDVLKLRLKEFKHRPLKIGSFSAGSNIVGVPTDTDAICVALHEHGAYAVFDYAGVGAYQDVNMFGKKGANALAYKDAVAFSPHKMVGGPQGSGLLVIQEDLMKRLTFEEENDLKGVLDVKVKNKTYMMKMKKQKMDKYAKKNLRNKGSLDIRHEHTLRGNGRNPLNLYTPSKVGGGVVDFTSVFDQAYLSQDREGREEAGTPSIVSDIRAGLAIRIQNAIGLDRIAQRDHELWKVVSSRLSKNANISILGNTPVNLERVPVLSFRIRSSVGRRGLRQWVHHNFVAALLNDLFGIQARSGCMCAGLLTAELLDISDEEWLFYEDMFTTPHMSLPDKKHFELCKPGFTRLAFNYVISDEECGFMLDAIEWIADKAHMMYPFYDYNAESGAWVVRKSVHVRKAHAATPEESIKEADQLITLGKKLLSDGTEAVNDFYQLVNSSIELNQWRWFVLPEDVLLKSTSHASGFGTGSHGDN